MTAINNKADQISGCLLLEENKGEMILSNLNLKDNYAGDSSGAFTI